MADPYSIGEFIAQDDPAPACDGLLDDIADALEGVPDGPWTPLMHDVHDRALIVTNVAAPRVIARCDGEEECFDGDTLAALRVYIALMSPMTTRALLARIESERSRASALEDALLADVGPRDKGEWRA